MIEKHIVLEHIDLVTFYGVNNMHLQMIKALYPKLRIVARGNIIKVMGDEEEMCSFEENINKMQQHCLQYNSLNEEDILLIVKGGTPACKQADGMAICYSVTGKPIAPRSDNHRPCWFRQDIRVDSFGSESSQEQGDKEDYPLAPSCGSRRKTRIPPRRHEGQD